MKRTTIIKFANWSESQQDIIDSYNVWKDHENKTVYLNDALTNISNNYDPKIAYLEGRVTKVFKSSIHVIISSKTREEIESEIYHW